MTCTGERGQVETCAHLCSIPQSAKQQKIDQYSKMVAFLMSYSFSDAEQSDPLRQTQMVPVIDLLNHHSYHHAELIFQEDYLLLTAIRNIKRVRVIQ